MEVADPLGKAELQTALGNAYLATGNADAANTAFAAALSAKPDYGRAMLGAGVCQGRRAGSAGRAGAGRKRRRQGPEARRGAAAEGRPAARAGRTRQGDRGLPRGAGRQGRLPAGVRCDRRPAGRAGQARRRGQGVGGDAEGRAQASADALPQVDARVSEEGLPGGEGGDPGRAAGGTGLPARPAAVGRDRLRVEVVCAGRGEPRQGAAAGAQRHVRAPGAGCQPTCGSGSRPRRSTR